MGKNSVLSALLRMLFPVRCAGCHAIVDAGTPFCPSCLATLPAIQPPLCPRCGRQRSDCSGHRLAYAYQACGAPFYYEGAIQEALVSFKFKEQKQYAQFFAQAMNRTLAKCFPDIAFDCMTVVPLHTNTYRDRRYNQSELLARAIAPHRGIAFEPHLLIKARDVAPQHTLKARQRIENVKGAFRVKEGACVSGKTILLCDDIQTTGATLHECAQCLLAAGAKAVYGICAATTR